MKRLDQIKGHKDIKPGASPGGNFSPRIMSRVEATIGKYAMLGSGESVLVGLSGGPDSVCLLSLLCNLKDESRLTLHAVYVDHNLRPEETPGEIEFCRGLCTRMGVNFAVRSVDVMSYAKGRRLNKQEAGRELRYAALEEAASAVNAGRIALAHNADDQVETLFMRILRGAGPKGLSGMPARRGRIIRPLIEIERKDIEAYLAAENLTYIVDSSNLKMDYLRNRIRRVLIPAMKELNPSLAETVMNTVAILQEEERYFDIMVTKTLMKMISRKTVNRIELFLSPMVSMDTVILRRVLRRAIVETGSLRGISFLHIEDIIDLVKNGLSGSRLYLPRGIRVIKDYSLLVITSEESVKIDEYEFCPPSEVVVRGTGIVVKASFEDVRGDPGNGKSSVLLDAGAMKFPLRIRPRAPGDFFFPMGFGKRKKLQDFFVDAKVPRDERDRVPIMVSGDDIVWIAGHRADDRFRIKEDTRKFLRLDIKKGNF